MGNQDFVKYHLVEALESGLAESNGDEDLSRHLHARVRLRLITMSDEELWKLAKLTADPPLMPVELAYQDYKRKVEELRATASEWINDLQREEDPATRKERMPDRILIIESEPFLNEELASTLTEAGFMVGRSSSYHEALAKLDEFEPHIIVTNESLSDKNGIEASLHLVNRLGIPTILVGNDHTDAAWSKLTESCADHYIRLPIVPTVFVARVKAILRRYEEHRCAY